MDNLREAITGCLSVPLDVPAENPDDQILEIVVMTPLSRKELARLLEKNGWSLQRVQGSHHIS